MLKSAFSSEKKPRFCQTDSLLTFSFWFVDVRINCVFKLQSFSVASFVSNIVFPFSTMDSCFKVAKKEF